MGTHPHGPAHLFSSPSTALYALTTADPARMLGHETVARWPDHTHVPFLFKILSIAKALPLQVHPDKAAAERLRSAHPDLAPDDNHKPEIAVAIGRPLCSARTSADDPLAVGDADTAFTGFVGFRPLDEIRANLHDVPELRDAVGDTGAVDALVRDPDQAGLRRVFGALLQNAQRAEGAVRALVERVRASSPMGAALGGGGQAVDKEEQARLLVKVEQQYPGDVGALATVFFMNLVKLRRGEAVYIGADEVHAYLAGDIIECMAVSDNVLNAAFAPPAERAQHVPAFVAALTCTARPPAHWALRPSPCPRAAHAHTTQYAPPLEEFVVLRTALRTADAARERLGAVKGPTVGIVTRGVVAVRVRGRGEEVVLPEGGVVYVVPGNEVEVELQEAGEEGEGEVWWAACLV
ncbi:hypothetical protein AcW1_001956 [Taiwanofungus camphoratus]|nr:hypothetical protein AcW1_001956 [Antrodia cinnamomea]